MVNRGWEAEEVKAVLCTAPRRTSTGCLGRPGLFQNGPGVFRTPELPQQKPVPLRCFLASQDLSTELRLQLYTLLLRGQVSSLL